jgi:uroporphyrinogen-III decarboxylase
MIFQKKDWKECLPEEIREKVKKAIEETLPYSCAVIQSKDARIAQLWVAIALLKKELEEKTKLIEIAVKPWKSIVEMGEIEKRKTIERIVTDLLQPKDKDQKEIVDKLVESLMKF